MKQSTHGKKFIVLCSVLMALCLAFSTCLLAACNPAEQAVSGNEVGVYYYQPTSQSREDVVTLSEGLIFSSSYVPFFPHPRRRRHCLQDF